ncbi:MAG: hypothetical protein H7X80_07080, partial [bacterium]|nr:hypothetical protein [Candidatus Kapabacteria bacterium]
MYRFLLTALVALITVVCASDAVAQTYGSNAGLREAETIAKDSLGADAVLYSVVGFGTDPLTLSQAFNIETGMSTHWVYAYYSPARNKVYTHIMYQPAPGFFSGIGEVSDPDPGINAS